MIREKVLGTLEEEDWTNVVEYMYSATDAEVLLDNIRNSITRKRSAGRPDSVLLRKKMTRQEVA
jgi:hypothetical protein